MVEYWVLDKAYLRQQILKNMDDLQMLRCGLEANKEVEKPRVEKRNRFTLGMRNMCQLCHLLRLGQRANEDNDPAAKDPMSQGDHNLAGSRMVRPHP